MTFQTFLFSTLTLLSLLLSALFLGTNTAICQEVEYGEKVELPTFKGQDTFTLSSTSDCAQHAQRDIENEAPRLIICYSFEGKIESHKGRYAGAFYANQREFEEKYGITYKLYSCTAENEKCVKNYNKQVLKHLSKKYRRQWKKEIRKDVYGL